MPPLRSVTTTLCAASVLVAGALAPRDGLAQFTAVTRPPLGVNGSAFGVAWVDFDGDGDPDLYVSHDGPNLLLRNDGAGGFTDVTAPPLDDPGNGGAAVWGDYDNDGDPDLYLVNYLSPNRLLRNDGAGGFTDVTGGGPLGDAGPGQGAAWADYDGDGDLDLYLVNYGKPNKLFHNDGGGVFSDATSGPLADNGWGLAAAWGDYDGDGDPDLYITNDGPNRLLRNDGGGAFTRIAGLVIEDSGPGQGAAWGDYDNDGDLDLYVANYGMPNKLIRNDGRDVFTALTAGALGDSGNGTGVAWGDYDNDGDLDLYLANYGTANRLLRNDGGAFTALSSGALGDAGNGTGVAWADCDGDGDLDLYVANDGSGNVLLRNDLAPGHHWLQLDLVGTLSNRSAIGARVRVVAGGVSRIQEVSGGSGYLSQNSLTLAFGLGAATLVDTLLVRWPSGLVERSLGAAPDRRLTLVEQGGLDVDPGPRVPATLQLDAPTPNPGRDAIRFRFALPSAGPARLTVHDVQGRLVSSLASGVQPAGWHALTWNGRQGRGPRLAAGVYVVRLETSGDTRVRKLVLVR